MTRNGWITSQSQYIESVSVQRAVVDTSGTHRRRLCTQKGLLGVYAIPSRQTSSSYTPSFPLCLFALFVFPTSTRRIALFFRLLTLFQCLFHSLGRSPSDCISFSVTLRASSYLYRSSIVPPSSYLSNHPHFHRLLRSFYSCFSSQTPKGSFHFALSLLVRLPFVHFIAARCIYLFLESSTKVCSRAWIKAINLSS